ncbi:MAG: hypothetical protein JWQ68_1192 [Cryobacterium sp.]|jgi:NAD(P)-dependent dehydrogenase (short-subunit alcohol dehydrogenase family)|nr:hypothetical protein [Cryobacterium sp.]
MGGLAGTGSIGAVVVIIGASSGIGRATAHAFARRGARLVLAARSEVSLTEVVAECRRHGAQAIAVPTDVTDEAAVADLAAAAVARFGRIDVWVGTASAFSYGTLERTPSDVFRQVVETTFFGQVNGARAVLPHFRRQGGGVLVMVGSVYSKITTPYVSPYVAGKHALLGFAEALGQEVRRDGIRVCCVLPATIDTPIYQHAANFTLRRVHPLPPVASPHRVARAIVRIALRPRRQVVVGQIQRVFIPLHAAAPGLYHRGVTAVMNVLALRGGGIAASSGTVFEPQPDTNRVTGGWRQRRWIILPVALVPAAVAVRRLRGSPTHEKRWGHDVASTR